MGKTKQKTRSPFIRGFVLGKLGGKPAPPRCVLLFYRFWGRLAGDRFAIPVLWLKGHQNGKPAFGGFRQEFSAP